MAMGATIAAALLGIEAPRRRRLLHAKVLLLCGSTLLSFAMVEGIAWSWQAWKHRSPDLSARALPPPAPPSPTPPVDPLQKAGQGKGAAPAPSSAPGRPIKILVIGESSARGEPYHTWLSIGQILGWQLESVFPGRKVEVDVQAKPGVSLEVMHQTLARIEYRPDVLVLYSGNNEFQYRHSWIRNIVYYDFERARAPEASPVALLLKHSPVCRLILETIERQTIPVAPKPVITRGVVDGPAYSTEEKAELVADFQRRLSSIAGYCERIGAVPVFVCPASNDRDFDPSRSVVAPSTTQDQIAAFTTAFLQARALIATDPDEARERLGALVAAQPSYAEAHFWYAKLLEAKGDWAGARHHYFEARERDGMPIRCLEAFRQRYREVAREFPSVVLVDGDAVLSPMTRHGVLGDHQFHDAHHPTLLSYIALTQNALEQIAARRPLGWPEGTPAPRIDPEACAQRFGLDQGRWATVIERTQSFYERTAYMKFDPTERNRKAAAHEEGARKVRAGLAPEETGLPGVGLRPTERPEPAAQEGSGGTSPARSRSM
jgi:hypothetical protein